MPTPIGALAVRRSIAIAATPQHVWQEFTRFERLKQWFGVGQAVIRFGPGPGGYLEIEAAGPTGDSRVFGGRIVAWEPPHEITAEHDWTGRGWDAPPFLTFRLTPILDGTVVEFILHSFERTGPSAADDHLAFERTLSTANLEALRDLIAPAD